MKHTIFKDNLLQNMASTSTLFAMTTKMVDLLDIKVVDGLRLTSIFKEMGYMTSLPIMEKEATIQQMQFPNLGKHQRKERMLFVIELILTRSLLSKEFIKKLRETKY